jgi:hypothetical protein
MMDAAAYLELLQQHHFGSFTWSEESSAAATEHVFSQLESAEQDNLELVRAEVEKRYAEARANRPSRYQHVGTYLIITDLAQTIEETAQLNDIDLPPRPIFGTLPIGQFNAMAILVPGTSEYIIVFQDGVFGFLNLISKCVAASFPTNGRGGESLSFSVHSSDVTKLLDRDIEPVRRFQQFVDAYVLSGDPHNAEQYLLSGPSSVLSSWLRKSAELFVMGHEYAHVILGHLTETPSPHRGLGPNVETITRQYGQEVEADLLGVQLSVATMGRTQGVDVPLAVFGAYLMFSAIDVVDRAVETLYPGVRPSASEHETHPPTEMRREFLAPVLANVTNEEVAGAAARLGEQVQFILDALWERSVPHYVGLRDSGAEPADMWLL